MRREILALIECSHYDDSITFKALSGPEVSKRGCEGRKAIPVTALSWAALITVERRRRSRSHTATSPVRLAVAMVATPSEGRKQKVKLETSQVIGSVFPSSSPTCVTPTCSEGETTDRAPLLVKLHQGLVKLEVVQQARSILQSNSNHIHCWGLMGMWTRTTLTPKSKKLMLTTSPTATLPRSTSPLPLLTCSKANTGEPHPGKV